MANQINKLRFRSIGKDVTIWPMAKIVAPETISIGNSVIIDDYAFLIGGQKTTIGDFVHIASFTSITGGGEFSMDSFSGLSGGVRIYTGNEDYSGECLTNPTVPFPYRLPIRSFVHIKKHSIIGANAVILPGVTIGEGAVVGANSLVKKDCKPWIIYAGNPAKELRSRPSQRIQELETRLRKDLYDDNGNYIALKQRHLIRGSKD